MTINKQMYYDEISSFIKSFSSISQNSIDELFKTAVFKTVKAGVKLENLGVTPSKVYLLNKGFMRSYFILENGKEVTKTIFTPIIFLASFNALLKQIPTETIYETLTDCDVYEIDYSKYRALCKVNMEILGFHSKFLEYLLSVNDDKHVELLTMDATQRYLKLRTRIPNIDNLIPQYQIATYLSVTPVQLSRIRAKL